MQALILNLGKFIAVSAIKSFILNWAFLKGKEIT